MEQSIDACLTLTNSIRSGLAIFSFLAVTPMLALVWRDATTEKHRILDAARDQMLSLARTTAEQQDDVIQEAENLVRVLVRVPAVAGQSAAECHDLLHTVGDDHPRIELLTIVDATGRAVCNSRDEKPDYNIADRGYFRELMVPDPPASAVSELVWGKRASRPVIVVAVPLPGLTCTVDGRLPRRMQWEAEEDQTAHLRKRLRRLRLRRHSPAKGLPSGE